MIALITAACLAAAPGPAFGKSMEVDPAFAYYQNRSPESIAAEIRANGYQIVRYILTADSNVSPALVAAFQHEGIGVWYATFCNGTYTTKDLPPGWEAWRMVTRSDVAGKPFNDGYTRLCLNNTAYRTWKKARIGAMLRAYPFVGVDLMEPHWPEHPGTTAPAYSCFCAECKAAFRRMFPEEAELPDVVHEDSPRHPGRNPELWSKWLRFRQASLTGFLDDIVNGPGGIRQSAPQAKVCIWTLALTARSGLRSVREDSGEDGADIARTVKPDLYCFQTHWPDWMRGDLAPDYVKGYRPFIDQVRKAAPKLPLMIQADTGSLKPNRRSWAWIGAFERACAGLGVDSTTCYEYFIGDYMYTDPPRIVEARWAADAVRLSFTKRLDPKTAGDPGRYALDAGRVVSATVDGSLVTLGVDGAKPGSSLRVTAKGISDAPSLRIFDDKPATVLDTQTIAMSP